MKNIIIGTAGHVDHGKTTLIKALSGIDTDRLIEEKKRGITIELGFAHIPNDAGYNIGVIDVPGHEKFIKHMLAGIGGIDFVLFVVAADEGIMPQTREHFEILNSLGINDGIIAVTKTDMVEEEWLEMLLEEVDDYFKGSFLEGKPVIPVSAATGEGIDELKAEIIAKCDRDNKRREEKELFRLPVDRVFTMQGFGTVGRRYHHLSGRNKSQGKGHPDIRKGYRYRGRGPEDGHKPVRRFKGRHRQGRCCSIPGRSDSHRYD